MAKLSQLLLYDPDPSGLETLSYVFEKEGCRVASTSDGTKVAELVQTEGPPLVLMALREPEQAAIELIREITGNPRTRNVACVAIGPARLRGDAVQAGAFGLLASPVFLRDVLDASKLVAAATVPGSRPSPETEIALKLSELGGVYYLIRALAASGRSAAVELSRSTRRGELRFIDGELSSVQIGALSGMAALHQALLWDEADLRLKFRNVVRRAGQLSLKSDELLEECDRFLRDFAHDVKDLGVAGTVYRPSSEARPTSSLPSEVVPLLRMFDGTRTLAQVLEESPFRVFDTLRIVHQFAAAEAIRADALTAPRPLGTPPGPAALAAWFQRSSSSSSVVVAPAAAEPAAVAPVQVQAPQPQAPQPPRLDEEDRPTPPPEPIPEAMARSDRSAGVPRRLSAPVVPVDALSTSSPAPRSVTVEQSGASAPVGNAAIPRAAKRTLTRRDYPIRNPVEPARPPAESAKPPLQASAIVTDSDLDSMDVTPPPIVSAVPSEQPRATSSSIARGEIQVAAPLPLSKKIEKSPRPNAPSVLVELGAVPQPRTPSPVVEAPLTARHLDSAPAAAAPPASAPSPSPANVSAPPPAKAPVLRRKTPVPAGGEPVHRTRTPSHGFNAMEADFFDREADLYKRESVESFDDLETAAQRGSVRKP